MRYEHILVGEDAGLAIVTMNRPERRNALSEAHMTELIRAFATPGGKGGWFCTTPMVAVARAVGRKRALEMLLTGDAIDAPTALGWGLVNRVVPRERLEEETRALARAASRGSSASKALGKRAF